MTFMQQTMPQGRTTPNIEKSEGVRVANHYVPASYLPVVRKDDILGEWKVIPYGKVVTTDSKGDLVPAGLLKDLQTAAADGNFDNVVNKYTASDVEAGVKNFAGADVEVDEPVVKSFFENETATDTLNNPVGLPLGMVPQDVWRHSGAGRDGNPTTLRRTNYKVQQGSTILTRYFIELPVVADTSAIKYPGLTVFEGAVKPGQLVTFNANSNYVGLDSISASAFAASTEGDPTDAELKAEFDRLAKQVDQRAGEVIGKTYFVDTDFPKDYLDYVKTWDPKTGATHAGAVAPGTATNGLPDTLWYAGVTDPADAKTVRLNLIIV